MSETLSLVEQVKAAMKAAMKAREKETLATIRLIQAEFKRVEVDERIEIDDGRALAIMDKMVKQRRDSSNQYRDANRPELADVEDAEIAIIQNFLPAQLSAEEIDKIMEWKSMETHWDLWKSTGIYGNRWKSNEKKCNAWASMKIH